MLRDLISAPKDEVSRRLQELVEALAEGNLSLLDQHKPESPFFVEDGDYFGHILKTRVLGTAMRDIRVLKRTQAEMAAKLKELEPDPRHSSKFNEAIRNKEGNRRFGKLVAIHNEAEKEEPHLLTGSTFEECLDQYQHLIGHVEKLWNDSCDLYKREHYPLATFTAILTIEETGKLSRLSDDLVAFGSYKPDEQALKRISRDHRHKHFIGVVSGAFINNRLDRILGLKSVRQVIQDAESGQLERLRQACLYIDAENGRLVTPAERIGKDTATFFTVLAGELWAEVLGWFPWDFHRMLDAVMKYELEIGLDPDKVKAD